MRSLVKLIFDIYARFGGYIKKVVPITVRLRIKDLLTGFLPKQVTSVSDVEQKPSGVNLVGYIRAETGLGHSSRLLANVLESSGLSWGVINFEKLTGIRYGDETWQHKIVKEPLYNTNIIHINPENMSLANMYLPRTLWEGTYSIGYYLWELGDIPDEWCEGFSFFQEIWAPSQFIIDTLKKKTDKPLLRVPYGISVENYTVYSRSHFKLPEDVFFFLCMYDVHSNVQRKNPMGAINAFMKAFEPGNKNVGLIVKINNAGYQSLNEIRKMEEELSEYQNVFFINETLARDEVNSLIYCSDAFISLHRSEGFGLVIAESMYLNKPVIATNWSSNVDFMNCDNSCPVDYKLVEIEKDTGPYRKGNIWAEPDISHAVHYMQRLAEDRSYYNQIAGNGRSYIKEHYSFENCAAIIKGRLKEIRS